MGVREWLPGCLPDKKLQPAIEKLTPLFNSVNMYTRYKAPKESDNIRLFHALNSSFDLIVADPMGDPDEGEELRPHNIRNIQNIVCTSSLPQALKYGAEHLLIIEYDPSAFEHPQAFKLTQSGEYLVPALSVFREIKQAQQLLVNENGIVNFGQPME